MQSEEWAEWYLLTPEQRWRETGKLWDLYLIFGGTLDPEPDSESPFDDLFEKGEIPPHRGTGMHIIRRSRV